MEKFNRLRVLQPNPRQYKDLRTVSYTFDDVGVVLPMHNHVDLPNTEHITIVARGAFLMRGPGWEQTVLAGAVIDFEVDQWHEFEALEADSKLVNVMKFLGEKDV